MVFRTLSPESVPSKGFIILCQERNENNEPYGQIKWPRSCGVATTELYYLSRSSATADLNGLIKNNRMEKDSIQYFFWISSVKKAKNIIKKD